MNLKNKQRPRKHRSRIVEAIKNNMNPLASARSKKKLILAWKIADAIDRAGIKRIELASRLSKEPSEITRWTSGDHNFTVDTLSDLEEILGIQLLSAHKTGKYKLHQELQCSLTIQIDAATSESVTKEKLGEISQHIYWAGGMQPTEMKGLTKQIVE